MNNVVTLFSAFEKFSYRLRRRWNSLYFIIDKCLIRRSSQTCCVCVSHLDRFIHYYSYRKNRRLMAHSFRFLALIFRIFEWIRWINTQWANGLYAFRKRQWWCVFMLESSKSICITFYHMRRITPKPTIFWWENERTIEWLIETRSLVRWKQFYVDSVSSVGVVKTRKPI